MANEFVAGVAYVSINGGQIELRGNLKVQPSTTKNEGVVGQDGPHGLKVTPILPYIEGDAGDGGGVSLLDISGLTDVTVTAELSSGKTYVLSNAWYAGEPELDTVEGKFTFRFEGRACQEILSA